MWSCSQFQWAGPWQHHGREYSSRQALALADELTSDPRAGGRERKKLSLAWALEISKPFSSDTLLTTKSHLPTLPKQSHQLGTRHSHIWTYGSHFHSNHHSWDGVRYRITLDVNKLFPLIAYGMRLSLTKNS